MCRSLVDKVARRRELPGAVEPGLLVLFEDWLEELEAEAASLVARGEANDAGDLARTLGISPAGADFLLARLRQEGGG
ncbi:MAG: hypothetical protein FJ128_03855 [Deltaproteobacteria bacterium]|nr:hypothetical protein [Deltaproteobacteria bacterium]